MANFTKSSGNSTKDVEQIAVIRPGRETKDGNFAYVEVMANNSNLTKADVAAGKGQANPQLYTKKDGTYTAADGSEKPNYEHGIRLSKGQVDAIEAAGGKNALTKEDGTKYIPFKSDVMGKTEPVKDADGKAVMDKDGKPTSKLVGYMPNTKTIEPSDLGKLTEKRLDKHFSNTAAINDVADAKKAAEKTSEKPAPASKYDKMAEAASVASPESAVLDAGIEK